MMSATEITTIDLKLNDHLFALYDKLLNLNNVDRNSSQYLTYLPALLKNSTWLSFINWVDKTSRGFFTEKTSKLEKYRTLLIDIKTFFFGEQPLKFGDLPSQFNLQSEQAILNFIDRVIAIKAKYKDDLKLVMRYHSAPAELANDILKYINLNEEARQTNQEIDEMLLPLLSKYKNLSKKENKQENEHLSILKETFIPSLLQENTHLTLEERNTLHYKMPINIIVPPIFLQNEEPNSRFEKLSAYLKNIALEAKQELRKNHTQFISEFKSFYDATPKMSATMLASQDEISQKAKQYVAEHKFFKEGTIAKQIATIKSQSHPISTSDGEKKLNHLVDEIKKCGTDCENSIIEIYKKEGKNPQAFKVQPFIDKCQLKIGKLVKEYKRANNNYTIKPHLSLLHSAGQTPTREKSAAGIYLENCPGKSSNGR